jgi:hypothetical protein
MIHRPDAFHHVPELAAKTLACAVIKQALADALDPTLPPEVQRDAQEFLAGDEWYRQWCTVAGLQPIRLLSRRMAA